MATVGQIVTFTPAIQCNPGAAIQNAGKPAEAVINRTASPLVEMHIAVATLVSEIRIKNPCDCGRHTPDIIIPAGTQLNLYDSEMFIKEKDVNGVISIF